MSLARTAEKPSEHARRAEPANAPGAPAFQVAETASSPAYARALLQRLPAPDRPDDEARAARAGGRSPMPGLDEARASLDQATSPLPHADRIQAAFGRHDISHVRAAIGGAGRGASEALGAAAFTSGDRIAFRQPPDLRLAAHESAHVVQQRAGVQLAGGVGTPGDPYERHADAVADAVASGRSAEHLLDQGPRSGDGTGVQMACACGGTCGACSPVQMFGWARTQHPNQPAYPSQPHLHPTAQCHPRALAALDTEVVELKGTPTFDPSDWLAEGLWCLSPGTSLVRTRFGTLARGVLRVRAVPLPAISAPGSGARPPLTYETATDEEFLELHHPAFPGGGLDYPPRLRIAIERGVVSGRVSFKPGTGRILSMGPAAWFRGYALERLLGWRGLRDVEPASAVNELRDGVLNFALRGFRFQLDDTTISGGMQFDADDALGGTGSFSVVDDAETFSAQADIEGEGITAGTLPLRKLADRISGSGSFAIDLRPLDRFGGAFSGGLEGTFAGGVLTLQGTARYRSRRGSGSLTVLLAPRAVAWARVSARLPPGTPNAPAISFGAATAPGYVLVGWGTVDFALTEWLTGSVSAVLDPDGYITSHGVLRPTREFQFLTDEERWSDGREIASARGSVTLLSYYGCHVTGFADAHLFAEGRVGPARVYGIEVMGSFSTRPGSVFEGSATGRINLSAWGRLRAELTGGLGFDVGARIPVPGFPDLTARVGSIEVRGTGTATVRAYAELQPTFERIADPIHPDGVRYRIRSELAAAGTLDLGLRGAIAVTLGPATIYTVNLGRHEWDVGSLGLRANIEHVIGSHAPIALDLESAAFNDANFTDTITELTNRRGARDRGDHHSDATQDPATAPAAMPDAPTTLERYFTMNGASHRLWVEHDPEAEIKMASDGPDDLSAKLQAEIAAVEQQQQQQTGAAAAELGEEVAAVRRLLAQTRAVEHSLDELQSESRQAGDVAGFGELADGLTTHGAQYQKSDLAQPTEPPASSVQIVDGRYVITNRAQLDAVRAIRPQRERPPENLDPSLQGYWDRYAGADGYFAERLVQIDRDLTRRVTTHREGPQTWDAYVQGRAVTDALRAAKQFQPELRELVIAEQGIDRDRVEIDVGVRATRRGVPRKTRYADVVVTDVANANIEVYSAKVHNVRTAAAGRTDEQVRDWIRDAMARDVEEAAQSYGYELEIRRRSHLLYGKRVYIRMVHLVWRYTSDLIPARFIDDILAAGADRGVRQRRTSRVRVDFLLRPEPPTSPLP